MHGPAKNSYTTHLEKESLIGKRLTKMDAPDKATGKTRYIQDINIAGQLYAKIKRSERVHARILKIDTSKAEALPGVRAVITAKDIPNLGLGLNKDNPPLKGDRVLSERDEIAAVAAETLEIAEQAVKLIEVEYEDLPIVSNLYMAMEPGSPAIHPDRPDNLAMTFDYEHGDVAQGEAESDVVIEDTFELHYVTHCCMGVSGIIAEFQSNGDLLLYSNTQVPFLHKREFAEILEMDPGSIRIIQPPIGGGFGSKLDIYPFEPICVYLAKITECPVKLIFTREEEFIASPTRQPVILKLRSGCKKDGTLTFRNCETLHDNGAYTSWGATTPLTIMQTIGSLYRVPHCKYNTKAFYTNNPYAGSFRGYGNLQSTFAVAQHMDKLAEAVNMDPIQFRLINAQEAGEITPQDLHFKSCGFKECITKAAEHSNFLVKHKEAIENQKKPGRVKRGIGIGTMLHVGGGAKIYRSDGCGTILKLDDFGKVTIITGASEIGQGSETVLSQLVCDELGLPMTAAKVVNNDTEITPWDVGVHASRTTFVAGNSALGAAKLAKEKILKAAARSTGHTPEELDLRQGCVVRADDGEMLLPLPKFLRSLHFTEKSDLVITSFYYEPPSRSQDKKFVGDVSAAYSWAAQVVEVEVDMDTGIVKIEKVTSAHDVGRVLNEMGLEGQVEGGIVMGQGYALCEDLMIENGTCKNPAFRDYKLITAPEVPEMDLVFIESMDGEGPKGAKGVAESPTICIAAATANAIYNATGVRIYKLPFTPENVYRALKGVDADGGQAAVA